jgi:hypothetical protein
VVENTDQGTVENTAEQEREGKQAQPLEHLQKRAPEHRMLGSGVQKTTKEAMRSEVVKDFSGRGVVQ